MCLASESAVPTPLVEITAFTELSADARDPFAALVPERVPCAPPAYVIEEDQAGFATLEVRTDVCNFITLEQPSQVPVRRGDTLQLLMWHNTLASDQSAVAHAAVSLDGDVVWSTEVPIPSPAESYTPEWRSRRDVPAGSQVLLHIDNHGANAWRFGELTLQR